MITTRRLSLTDTLEKRGHFMKVAFASTDKIHIDEHFGRAAAFHLWDIGPDSAEFSGIVQVDTHGDDEADRIEARCTSLADCALVYVAEIGGPAAARLVAKRIHPIKSKERAPIAETATKLQQVLQGTPPPWLRKAMLKNSN
jgi:nitrogen fixation protein NifX